jgi:hypothetical protein
VTTHTGSTVVPVFIGTKEANSLRRHLRHKKLFVSFLKTSAKRCLGRDLEGESWRRELQIVLACRGAKPQ